MDSLGKKAGYLQGLLEGMNFEEGSAEARLTGAIVDLLGDLSDRVESMDELLDDLNDYVESIDDDLAELEDAQNDDDIPDFGIDSLLNDADSDEGDDEPEQLRLIHPDDPAEDADEAESETLAGCICPKCNQLFFVDVDEPENASYVCPHCSETVRPKPLTPENAPIAHRADD